MHQLLPICLACVICGKDQRCTEPQTKEYFPTVYILETFCTALSLLSLHHRCDGPTTPATQDHAFSTDNSPLKAYQLLSSLGLRLSFLGQVR